MADPLLELLYTNEAKDQHERPDVSSQSGLGKYLSRLLSLRPSDLTSTEPQSLAQTSHTNLLSLQALSSRSHRSTIASSDQLATLQETIPVLTATTQNLQNTIPQLDSSAISFASTYSKTRSAKDDEATNPLGQRKDSMLLSRQATKLQDILELPSLLSTAIASAASGPAGSANYTQALDLYAHIRRLQILYPDSRLVADVQIKAEAAMKDMTTNLLGSLRAQNIRLAAAIRTIGWLRRVVPEITPTSVCVTGAGGKEKQIGGGMNVLTSQEEQEEGSFGALFLVARLSTFLSMTEDALAPLRDLADQETEKRLQSGSGSVLTRMEPVRRPSGHGPAHGLQGQQTERYLKRYIEIFREQSFATVQMYRNIFPQSSVTNTAGGDEDLLRLPSALASFPMHLVSLLMETLQTYLPNITDVAARESLLIQVLYAANSLGRLGADFSMMISLLDLPSDNKSLPEDNVEEGGETKENIVEPEWYRAIKKHRIQAARLDALASGQENAARRPSQDVSVR